MADRSQKDADTGEGGGDFLDIARRRYARAARYVQDNHEEALDDLRFRTGEQWPDDAVRMRKNRPMLTENHIPQYVRQVTGDIRLNKPAIRVRPVDSDGDPDIAEIYTGLIRNIEQQSMAGSVYAYAGDCAATCGEGHWRIVTDYADDDSFEQDIRIRRINNPLSVIWDPDSREPTREDAKYCFVLELYSKEEFKEAWPEASLADFEAEHPQNHIVPWWDGERIRVAEYWCKVPEAKKLARLPDGRVIDWSALKPEEQAEIERVNAELAAANGVPAEPIQFRDVETHRVERHIINGAEVLSGPEVWPGRHIPIISTFGEEIYVGDEVRRRGMVRDMKDPQRMVNYHASAAVEMVALAPKAPWVATPKMMEGLEQWYERANTENLPYLPYKPDPGAPGAKPERQQGPQVPAAFLQLRQEAINTLSYVTGIYPSSLGQKSNETSGKAILARERQGDVGTFVYIDNLSIAIGYCGRQLVDLIPKIYDTKRSVRILGEDDSEELIQLGGFDKSRSKLIDLGIGKYDVAVSTGPSFSTKRQESAEMLLQFVQSAPETAAIVMDMIAKNMDWPGAEEMAERFRAQLIKQGIVEADPEKGEQPPPPPPPDPALVKAEGDMAKAEADVAKTKAETQGQQLENAQALLELLVSGGMLQGVIREQLAAMNGQGRPNGSGSPGF